MNRLVSRVLFLFAFLGCLTLPAIADSTAFTDLGSGGSYNCCSGYTVSGGGTGLSVSWADGFTASVSGALSQIDVGLGHISGANNTNSAVISLYTDVGGQLGALLFSGTVTNQPQFGTTSTILATLKPSSGALTAGDKYFLVVAPAVPFTFDGWNYNNIGASGLILQNTGKGFGYSSQTTLGAFDVKVNASTTVPEPSTWLILGPELICLLGFLAVRRKLLA